MLSVDEINKLQEENAVLQAYKDVNEDFKKAWEELKEENKKFTLEAKKLVAQYSAKLEWQRKILQEIKGIAMALYMNEWLQQNETARKSIQLLQQKIAECEVE